MPQATFQFPTGFLWGTATAAHQVEGNNTNNNWAAWEAQPGHIIQNQKSGLACDWWGGRWKEDFERAAETYQNAHRMSIEWSRIQPAENRWDEHALDYYREMLRGLVQRNLTPLITLHHFTDPLWLYEQGGWENEKAIQNFLAFVNKTVEALKEYCNLWVTFNEPNVYVYSGYIEGVFPPGKKDMGAGFRVMSNMLKAHAQAYHAIHKIQPTARVGIAQHFRRFNPARPAFAPDAWIANFLSSNFNEPFLNAMVSGKLRFVTRRENIPAAAKTQDFVGVNYYTTDLIKFNPLLPGSFFSARAYPREAELSGNGYIANVPCGLFDTLQWATRFHLPLIVTENGVEDAQDSMRQRYIIEHLHQIWRGINFNWPIKGYFHWSLVDNFEWERGWTQRFGLWGLDLETQRRIRRTSVDVYSEICQSNAISSDLVAKYSPQTLPKLFPG